MTQERQDGIKRVIRWWLRKLKAEGFKGVLISTMGWENRLPEVLGGFGIE